MSTHPTTSTPPSTPTHKPVNPDEPQADDVSPASQEQLPQSHLAGEFEVVEENQPRTRAARADDDGPDTNDLPLIRNGLIFLALTLGLFTLWGAFAPLSSAIVSVGEVVVDSYRKSLQHYEGGIVKQIHVHNGDLVEPGQPLIELEATAFRASLATGRSRLHTTQAELERLMAEQDFAAELVFSDVLRQRGQSDPALAMILQQQQQLFQARSASFHQEQEALKSRIGQIRAQIVGLHERQVITGELVESLQEEQQAYKTLFDEGLGDGLRARELSRSVLNARNELANIAAEIARLEITATETELQITTRIQERLTEVGERIKQAQTEYAALSEDIEVARDQLERAIIRAPEQGVVVDMQVHTLGSVIQPGHTLMDLVPQNDSFVVEAKLEPTDINDVYPGQPVDIRFSAFNAKTTPLIEGEVISVSADRLLDDANQRPYYLVRIQITEAGQRTLQDRPLLPGMPAEAMIRRGDRTLFSYLFKPLTDSFARSLKED